MTPSNPLPNIKALTFDIFGTSVNWRSSVESALSRAFAGKPGTEGLHVPTFAQEWRDEYIKFTTSFEPGKTGFKSIDEHHESSLKELLGRYGVLGGFEEGKVEDLGRVWRKFFLALLFVDFGFVFEGGLGCFVLFCFAFGFRG